MSASVNDIDPKKTNQNKAQARPALGKGLASLIPQSVPAAQAQGAEAEGMPNKDRHPGIMMCALEDIVPNTYQPRHQFDDATIEELAQSIKENGLIQPLIVRRAAKGFQLIAGERRWRASKVAGLKQVPIVIRRTTDQEALELALIENIQREDLNCIDTALAYQQLMTEFDLTQELMAKRVGKDRATVANHLRLLRLPESVVGWLRDGTLSYGHGKALAGLDDQVLIERLAAEVVDQRLSVRQLEANVQAIKAAKVVSEPTQDTMTTTPWEQRLGVVSKELSQRYSAKVQVKGTAEKGKIIMDYSGVEELNRLLDSLQR